jgi:hypothetical protein
MIAWSQVGNKHQGGRMQTMQRKGIEPLTEQKKTLIVNNVLKACKRIEDLNPHGYGFLYLASGFIAHYNRGGFIDFYRSVDLTEDIKRNASMNQWDNFHPGEENFEYYMSKKEVYNRILKGLGA